MGYTVLIGLLAAGCESTTDDTTDSSSSGTNDVSGTWSYSNSEGDQSMWALVQSDETSITGAGTGGESIRGTISGSSIYVSLTYSSARNATLSGTVSDDTMTGSYTNTAPGSGSWVAIRTD